jgi:hypothetical protein
VGVASADIRSRERTVVTSAESADPFTALGMTAGADPFTALGMTAAVIPSERSESRDLHLRSESRDLHLAFERRVLRP